MPRPLTETPRSLILTVLGAYIRRLDGWISIAGLIRVLEDLGLDAQTVRSAVSRLKRRELVAPARRWGAAGYVLAPQGKLLIQQGDSRIYGRPRDPTLREGWAVALFSVPDARRSDRHLLRSNLSQLGFGTLGSAVWLAPWHVADEAERMLVDNNLDQYVHLFRADYMAFGTPADLVRESWDVPRLAARYHEFQEAVGPIATRWSGGAPDDDRACLVDHIEILSRWRVLAFLDPSLPAEALPDDWPAPACWDLFHDLSARLEERAVRYVLRLTGIQ